MNSLLFFFYFYTAIQIIFIPDRSKTSLLRKIIKIYATDVFTVWASIQNKKGRVIFYPHSITLSL